MKITAEVRDYAAGMTDNEKADLERQAAAVSALHREGVPEAGSMTKEEAEEGMKAKSAEFMAQGAEIYVERE